MTAALAKLDLCIDTKNSGELIDRRPLVKKLLSDYKQNKSEAESFFNNPMSFATLTEEELRQVENKAWNWFHTVIDEDNPKDENLKIESNH